MRWRSVVSLVVAASAVSFTAGRVFSQDAKPAAPSAEDMQKAMEEAARPIEQHKAIAAAAGEWDSETTCWFNGPEGEATKSKGSSSSKMILNGLWMVGEHKGEMMGKPFEGHEVFGYDKGKNQYFGVFVCSMGTNPEVVWGTSEDQGKTISLTGGEVICGGMTYTPKWVIKHVDADHMTFEHWSKMAGAPDFAKDMEIKSTRRK